MDLAHQAPLSMEFSRQEYWCGFPCPPPGDLPAPGIQPTSPGMACIAGVFFTAEPLGEPSNGRVYVKLQWYYLLITRELFKTPSSLLIQYLLLVLMNVFITVLEN